ncbi:MAG: hypothetical protein ABI863_07460 [Ginsengibacter sp.]
MLSEREEYLAKEIVDCALYRPFAVSVINDQLIVADTGDQRIVFYTI